MIYVCNFHVLSNLLLIYICKLQVIYGASAHAISIEQGCTLLEAQRLMRDFLKAYPGISRFVSDVKLIAKRCGYVETLLGRRRAIDAIGSSSDEKRAHAERQAVNTVCQGSAADLIKLAMVNIFHQVHYFRFTCVISMF
jgi:DNA polymerase I-like protein with 3'-5' exonuclease and polymerase domains